MANITFDKFPKQAFEDITFKKVKLQQGREGVSMSADVYFKKKLAGFIYDDGFGGGTWLEAAYLPKMQGRTFEELKVLEKYVEENNLKQVLFDNGWEFMEDVNKIDVSDVIDCMIMALETKKDFEKRQKQKILFEDNKGGEWSVKLTKPISELNEAQRRASVLSVKTRNRDIGCKILNTNLGFDPNA